MLRAIPRAFARWCLQGLPPRGDWLVHGMGRLFPAEWDRLLNALPADFRELGVLEGYHRLLNSPRIDVRLEAARNWHDWEAASILLVDPKGLPRRWQDSQLPADTG